MARVEVIESLKNDILAKFKKESKVIFQLLRSLGESPHEGKLLGNVGGIVIKELKYKNFRFYFITDGFKLKCMDEQSLVDILLQFVRMSDKKHQQKVIDEIKQILRTIGPHGFG
jgi:hypothetical protein